MKLNSFCICLLACFLFSNQPLNGQSEASVILNSGSTVRGSLTSSNPNGITIETSRGPREVTIGDLRQIRLPDEPSWLNSAKARYRESRFDACYEELNSGVLETNDKLVKQEVAYYKAMTAAQLAMTGGDVSAKDAGNLLIEFTNENPDSFNLFPAIEAFADLAVASGGFSKAAEYYEKLQNVQSGEFKSRSAMKMGRAKLYAEDYKGAVEALTEVEKTAVDENKLLARCLLAQAMSYEGKADEAIIILQEVIKNESSTQTDLFARAYNALGVCYLNKQDLKAARIAFLHTQLLFFNDGDAHAEALFHMYGISNKLNDSERTAQARQLLKSRYRNTHWAGKL